MSARRAAAAELQRKQEQEAWNAAKPERDAAERARRAWIVVESAHLQKIPARQQRGIVTRCDKQFQPPDEAESPAAREKRIDQVMREMNQQAYDWRRRELERPKLEAERAQWKENARQRELNKDKPKTPYRGHGF